MPSAAGALLRVWLQQHVWSLFDGKKAVFTNVAQARDAAPSEFAADVRTLVSGSKLAS